MRLPRDATSDEVLSVDAGGFVLSAASLNLEEVRR
jgi:hypothetical protein